VGSPGQLFAHGHDVRNARVPDLALRPYQSLGECLLGHEKRARNLRSAQAAEQAQRQGDLRIEGEGRMAAGEDEPEAVVLDRVAGVHGRFSAIVRVGGS